MLLEIKLFCSKIYSSTLKAFLIKGGTINWFNIGQ